MANDYYKKITQWNTATGNRMNVSHYIFRDVERTGNYDILSKPMMKVAVKLTRPNGTYVVKRSNLQGFVNFTNSMIASPVDVWEPGVYKVEVIVPDGWEVTTGNKVQLMEYRESPKTRPGIVVDSVPEPIGLAQILTIEGNIELPNKIYEDASMRVIAITPNGQKQNITTQNGYFKFNATKGKWKIVVTFKDGQTVYEREINVTTFPIKLSTIKLEKKNNFSPKSVIHTVDFEELIPTEIRKMPNGIASLNWKNLIVTHHEYYNGEGYVNGLISGKYIGYNTSGYPVTISKETGFDFYGGYFTVAWLQSAEGETLEVRAWRGEELVAYDEFELSAMGPFWLDAQYMNITKLQLATKHYWQFVVDHIVVGVDEEANMPSHAKKEIAVQKSNSVTENTMIAYTKPLIGMLRHSHVINASIKAAAYVATNMGCEFVLFHPENIDFTNKLIYGQVFDKGEWKKQWIRFPDVVDNSPMQVKYKEQYEQLQKLVPFTTYPIGNKQKVNERLLKDKTYAKYVIPSKLVSSAEDYIQYLNAYRAVVIKPVGGNQGKDIYFILKYEDGYLVNTNKETVEISEEQLQIHLAEIPTKNMLVQPFIKSITDEGLPFDIRIHVRRGSNGEWNLVKMYPRIGTGDGIASNLTQGGSIAKIEPFLKRMFENQWENIYGELLYLAKGFPEYFQKGYDVKLDALGLDIGIDESGKLWIYEVNYFPGCTMFEIEAQEVAMQYAKYIAERNNSNLQSSNLVQADKTISSKITIGLLSDSTNLDMVKISCADLSSFYDCNFFYFTPQDVDFKKKTVQGKVRIDGTWQIREYSLLNDIDVIYDRIRQMGTAKYANIYNIISHIPITHRGFGKSIDKLSLYEKLQLEQSVEKYLIPFESYSTIEAFKKFVLQYNTIIIKPRSGYGGKELYLLEFKNGLCEISQKENKWKISLDMMDEWIEKYIVQGEFILQKYIHTRTKENAPFDIRVHIARNEQDQWQFIRLMPRIGVDYEKITPLTEGGYVGYWKGFIIRNYGEEQYVKINNEIRQATLKIIAVAEKIFNQKITEAGFDFAISPTGELYLLELNLRRPGSIYSDYELTKAIMGYAKNLVQSN